MAGAQVHGRRFGRPAVGRICNGLYPFPRDRGRPPAHAPLRGGARAAARSRSRQLRRSREHPPRCAARRTGKAKAEGLWAPQAPKDYGGMGLPIVDWAVMYEEANRSIFGPLAFNCAAPDDGNMNLLARVGTPAQKDKWLKPIVEGKVRSSFAMTEPAPGGGSDPGMIRTRAEKKGNTWKIYGRKWFITGADGAAHFILAARTSDDKRKGITTFLFHKDQPGWRIIRRSEIMGPEEHGGHCEIEFDGLELHE